MKLQECRDALKTMPPGDPRRGKILEEMERIKKWMISQGYGGKSKGGFTPIIPLRSCSHCNGRETHPHPIKPEMCTGCGNNYI